MAVTRKIRHMNEDGSIVEADIGALAENVKEDENRRFVSDEEKAKWNGQVAANGGDISDTITDITEPTSASTKYPTIPASGGTTKTIMGYLTRWVKSLKNDKVDKDGGDVAGTKVNAFVTPTSAYPIPAVGDSVSNVVGKISKFFSDILDEATGACFIGQIVDNCTSEERKKPLSANQGRALLLEMAKRAPVSHADTSTAYGGGTASQYGHVKLSDSYTSSGGAAANSVGASSKALADAYNVLNTNKLDAVSSSNFSTEANALGNIAIFRRYPNGMKSFRIYGTIKNALTANTKYELGTIGGIYLPFETISKRVIYTPGGHYGYIEYSSDGTLSFTPITVPSSTGYIMYVYEVYY